MSSTANSHQIGGKHYQTGVDGTYQHWDFVLEVLGGRYLEGNITKYLFRWRSKDGVLDLRKAQHYLNKLIEQVEAGCVQPLSFERSWRSDRLWLANNGFGLCGATLTAVQGLSTWHTMVDLLYVRSLVTSLILDALRTSCTVDPYAGDSAAEPSADSAAPGTGYVDQG